MKKFFIALALSASFIILPQPVEAQVSSDTAHLLRAAGIQVLIKGEGLEILAVNMGENTANVRQFIQNNRYTFPVPMDNNRVVRKLQFLNNYLRIYSIFVTFGRENTGLVRKLTELSNKSNSRKGALYGVEAISTFYILDREGRIITRVVSSIYWDTPQVIAALIRSS